MKLPAGEMVPFFQIFPEKVGINFLKNNCRKIWWNKMVFVSLQYLTKKEEL